MKIPPQYKYYAFSAACLVVIVFSIYYLLGGTKDYYVTEGGNAAYDIAGKAYRGSYSAESARVVFEEFRDKVQRGEWKGDLVEITYPPEEDEEVNQFFGVLLTGNVTQIESDQKLIKLEAEKTLLVALEMHPLVRPSREKVEAMLYSYAQEKGWELEDYFMQRYLPDNSVVVEAFVK